jgi:hypothetical protein
MGVGMVANHIRQHRSSVVVLGGGVQQFMRVVVESLPGDKVFHVDHFRRVLEGETPQEMLGDQGERQGLRTTFSWVFWGFHGKYNRII